MSAPISALDPATRALVALAAAIATGDEESVVRCGRQCLKAGVPAEWVDELLLQSLLMAGWPRTLVAARAWRSVSPQPARANDLDYANYESWVTRGEENCRLVYGDHYDKLRANVRALHPALDAWMVAEGYGRTLGRPGLGFPRRELCVVAQTAVLNTPRQLRSHLLGALRVGATPEAIGEALDLIEAWLPPDRAEAVRDLWAAVRRIWETA